MKAILASILVSTLSAGAVRAESLDLTDDWLLRPDPTDTGLANGWHETEQSEEGWVPVRAGARWEDQGMPDLDGVVWYRRWVDVPGGWRGRPAWLVLGGINDAGTLYCNGRIVRSYGDASNLSVHATPLIAELSGHLRFGERNLLAIRVLDWGGSGGLQHRPCRIAQEIGALPIAQMLGASAESEPPALAFHIDLTGLGKERPAVTLRAQVTPEDSSLPEATGSCAIPAGTRTAAFTVPLSGARQRGRYHVRVVPEGPDGEPIDALELDQTVTLPGPHSWPPPYDHLRVLNNCVTELLSVASVGPDASAFTFDNPRAGWVFVSLSAGDPEPQAWLDGDRGTPLPWRVSPQAGAHEAMRWLESGQHELRLARSEGLRLDVRAVPELIYCYYPAAPHIAPYGTYDWAYLSRHVLPHVNTIVTAGGAAAAEFEQWCAEGRRWLGNAGLPGLSDPEPPDAAEVYGQWRANPGAAQPGFRGIMVDEFISAGPAHYAAWTEACRRLHADPVFAGRTFYAWCGDLHRQEHALGFARILADRGGMFSWEKYLQEEPTLDAARSALFRHLDQPMSEWRSAMPGIEQHLVVCLGYLCAPPETLNALPQVDYHVFMDMQLHRLATAPAFRGIAGIMEYSASYADEESLRYAHRLFRHYCIEGRRTRFNADPYLLPHVANPDFADGLAGWEVQPAADGGIAAGAMEGLGWLQGRYPRTTAGDRFCQMTRAATRPNLIRQALVKLNPDRVYSLKLITADVGRLAERQLLAVSVQIDDAEILDEHSFRFAFASCYSHELPPYDSEHPAHMNLHRVVFRPRAPRAQLTISDWLGPEEPGGPAGQVIAVNFVEVQPFVLP